LVAVWKEKKSGVNTTKGIKNIPRKIPQSVWQNVREGQCVAVHFEKGVAPILNAKMRFRPKRGIAFLPADFGF